MRIKASFVNLPFKQERIFDLIIWCEGPEHARNPKEIMIEIKKLTKKFIVIGFPYKATSSGIEHFQDRMDENTLRDLLDGFDILEYKIIDNVNIVGIAKRINGELI